jgi:hypothetical protein
VARKDRRDRTWN